MQEVQLYINSQRVELFKDESISLTSSIQNVRDISKVFTDFSKQFNLPASKVNNKIFKHYYNNDIDDGFDARKKVNALIKLNGIDFRKGYVRLNDITIKNGLANTYKITFFGETISLKDVLGEDYLESLDLSDYNHTYDVNTVYNGLVYGLGMNGVTNTNADIAYSLISHTNRLIYDSSSVGTSLVDTTNIYTTGGTLYGLDYTQLKPSIKIKHIIDAIENKYPSITFSNDFFNDKNITDLYLLLHREKGNVYGGTVEQTKIIDLNDWNFNTGTNNITQPLVSTFTNPVVNNYWELSVTITPTVSSALYNVSFVDKTTGNILSQWIGQSGTNAFNYDIITDPITTYKAYDLQVIVTSTDSNFTSFTPTLQAVYTDNIDISTTIVTTGNYSTVLQSIISDIIISEQMPKMKIIDFLTSIFKMFNLTAYVENDIMIIDTLDNFYSAGVNYDITKYIDTSNSNIKSASLYKEISFKYSTPKTYLTTLRNDKLNEEFGNLEYDGGDKYDGGKYEVKLNFEHSLYERLTDSNVLSSNPLTEFQYGWLASNDKKPILTAPLIHYVINESVTTATYKFGFIGKGLVSQYNRASNVRDDDLQTINFNAEVDEWSGSTNNNSLFENFYKNYITNLFNVKTRIINITAYLPLSILLNYNLNDRFIVNGKKHKISSVNTNLQTGKSSIELISEV